MLFNVIVVSTPQTQVGGVGTKQAVPTLRGPVWIKRHDEQQSLHLQVDEENKW